MKVSQMGASQTEPTLTSTETGQPTINGKLESPADRFRSILEDILKEYKNREKINDEVLIRVRSWIKNNP